MTRLPDGAIRPALIRSTAADGRGTRFRLTMTAYGLTMRPLRSRKPDAEVFVPWSVIYDREKLAELTRRLQAREKARRVKRARRIR